MARASWSSSTFSPCVTSPKYSIPAAEVRLDELGEVLPLLRLPVLARHLQRQAQLHRDRDRPVRALVRAEPAQEEQVVAAMRLARVETRSIAFGIVAAHGRSGIGRRWFSEIEIRLHARRELGDRPVRVLRLVRVERPVHGVQDWSLDQAAERGCRNPGVVVDHVELVRPRVAGEGVAHLRQRAPDQLARRLLEDVREVRLRQRVAGREERHVVARVGEPVREQRDDELDAPVAGRRHGEPDGRQNGDAQLVTHAVRPERCHPRRARPNSCRTRGSR